jgi:hypothetical protein
MKSKKKLLPGKVIKLLKTGAVNKYFTYINYTLPFFPSSSVSQIPSLKSIVVTLQLTTKFVEFIMKIFKKAHISNLQELSKPNIIETLLIHEKKIRNTANFHE